MNKEMKQAIDQRLNDRTWDMAIAQDVIKRRRKRNRTVISTASSVVAACLVFVLYISLNPGNTVKKKDTLNTFITKQINGAYKEAVTVNGKTEKTSQSLMDFDSLIDDSLSQRGI
jgi:hypothetical protein